MNAVWGSGVFEIEKHNAFTSFLLGIEYDQGHEPRLSSRNIRNRVDITLFVGDEEI